MAKTNAVKKATRKAAKADKAKSSKKSRRTVMDDLLDDAARANAKKPATKKSAAKKVATLSRKIAKATGVGTTDGSVKQVEAAPICEKPKFFGRRRAAKKGGWSALTAKEKEAKREQSRSHWKNLPEGHWHRVFRKDVGAAYNMIKRGEAAKDAKMIAAGKKAVQAAKDARDAAKAKDDAAAKKKAA